MKDFEENWEKIHSSREWGKYPPEHLIRFISRTYKNCSSRQDIKILDIGCGGGANTWYLAKEGFTVYAFDGSKSAVENTRKYLMKEGVNAELTVQNGLDMDYPDEFFDCIVDNASICCMGKRNMINEIYGKVYKCLKKGGWFYTVNFTENTYGAGTGTMIEKGTYQDEQYGMAYGVGHIHYTNEEELTNDLSSKGFNELSLDMMKYSDRGKWNELIIAFGRK